MTRKPRAGMPGQKPALDREMSDLGTARKVRFGLASKITLPVILVLAGLIALMGLALYGSSVDALEFQFNQHGTLAARIAAAPEIDSWDAHYNTYENLSERLGAIAADLVIAGGGSVQPAGSETDPAPAEAEALRKRIAEHDRTQSAYNRSRLERIVGTAESRHAYLDFWILVPDSGDVWRAGMAGKAKNTAAKADRYRLGEPLRLTISPDTLIHVDGTYTTGDDTQAARFFFHPIKDKDARTVGQAVVVFSEEQIRQDKAHLKSKTILFCILGVLVTAAVTFFATKVITRPLGHLLKDIKAVAGGDLSHRTKVRTQDEIGTLAASFDQMTRNLADAEVMRVDLAEKEHQVSLAQEVQERLFPRSLPQFPGFRLDAGNRLAGDLSADLFDAVSLQDGRVALVVMTASGSGMPAAIVLSMARALFRARAVEKERPSDGLIDINRILSMDLRRGMYVSALYAILDPTSGRGTLASAGHRVPALHFVKASGGLRRIQADGIAMGLDKGPVFERSLTETPIALGPGDRLILATEGAFVLTDQNGQPLGEQGFLRAVLAGCKQGASVDGILSILTERLGAAPDEQDVTLVSAEHLGDP